MHRLRTALPRRAHDRGATSVEYGLLVTLIAVAVVAALLLLGPTLGKVFGGADDGLEQGKNDLRTSLAGSSPGGGDETGGEDAASAENCTGGAPDPHGLLTDVTCAQVLEVWCELGADTITFSAAGTGTINLRVADAWDTELTAASGAGTASATASLEHNAWYYVYARGTALPTLTMSESANCSIQYEWVETDAPAAPTLPAEPALDHAWTQWAIVCSLPSEIEFMGRGTATQPIKITLGGDVATGSTEVAGGDAKITRAVQPGEIFTALVESPSLAEGTYFYSQRKAVTGGSCTAEAVSGKAG